MRELSFTNRIFIRLLTGFVLVSMIDTVNSMIDGIVIARFVGGSARNVMALFFLLYARKKSIETKKVWQ